MAGRARQPRRRSVNPTGLYRPARGRRPDARLRRARLGVWLLALLAVVAFAVLDRRGALFAPSGDEARYEGAMVRIVRVVDGDTLIIDVPDAREERETTRVRLWGIDAPELSRNGAPAEAFAEEARRFAATRTMGREVTLRLEERTRDRYGRLLAHVMVEVDEEEGGTERASLAALLAAEGLAKVDPRFPHGDMEMMEEAERGARRAQKGQWAIGNRE